MYVCPNWEKACRRAGLVPADDISYAYTGQISIAKREEAKSAKFRIAGDTEQEGDEVPCIYSPWPWVHSHGPEWRWRHRSDGFAAGYVDPGYRYVGGLEQDDNHGQDGVNVLYLDWHAGFDGRSWPSPLGAVEQQSDSFPRCQWGAPMSGDNTCTVGYQNENLQCDNPKPSWCNHPNRTSGWVVNKPCPWN